MSAAWAGLHPRSGSMEAGEGRHELDTGRHWRQEHTCGLANGAVLLDWPWWPDSLGGLAVMLFGHLTDWIKGDVWI